MADRSFLPFSASYEPPSKPFVGERWRDLTSGIEYTWTETNFTNVWAETGGAPDFPPDPTVGETHTYVEREWTWNGTGWERSTTSTSDSIEAANAAIESLHGVVDDETIRSLQEALNYIPNNTFEGVVPGTPGASPEEPGEWPIEHFSLDHTDIDYGVHTQIVGTGVENNIKYVDWRIWSPEVLSGARGWLGLDFLGWSLSPEPIEQFMPAVEGEYATISGYFQIVAGGWGSTTCVFSHCIFDENLDWVRNVNYYLHDNVDSVFRRHSHTTQFVSGDVFASSFICPAYSVGDAFDYTLRIGLLQHEHGSVATRGQRTPRLVKFATKIEAEAGDDDKAIMTPKRTAEAIAALVPEILPSINQQTFISDGTWEKPVGFAPESLVHIEGWGPGAGGARCRANYGAGGAGGGAYNDLWCSLADLDDTVDVTIGLGGLGRNTNGNGSDGQGPTTFGAFLTAYQGSGGTEATSCAGGSGGGPLSAASGHVAGEPHISIGSVNMGDGAYTDADLNHWPAGGGILHGGGGGAATDGGSSIWGGGAGASCTDDLVKLPGKSVKGGNGGIAGINGANGADGEQPGGGGGSCEGSGTAHSGKGGDGKVVVTVFRS